MDIAIKSLGPLLFMLLWAWHVNRARTVAFFWISLFFTSIAGFSQNFEFIYRELHQGVQIPMMVMGFLLLAKGKFLRPIGAILSAFLGLILLSLLINEVTPEASSQLLNFLVVMGTTIFIMTNLKKLPDNQIALLLRFISQLGGLAAVIGILEFLTTGNARVEATFANPNYFALFIGISYCFAVASKRGPVRLIILALIITAIVLSGSRSAIILPVFSHLWMIVSRYSLKERFARGFIIIVLGGAAFMATGLQIDREGADASDAERYLFWQIGIEMAKENPWFGVGWGNYISEFSNYSHLPKAIFTDNGVVDTLYEERRVSHNDYVRILAELGIPAFILSVILTFAVFFRAWKLEGPFQTVVMPVWMGLFLFSLVHNNLNTAYFWVFFLLPHLHWYSGYSGRAPKRVRHQRS